MNAFSAYFLGIASGALLLSSFSNATLDKAEKESFAFLSFKDAKEASFRREHGELSKEPLEKACREAVDVYLHTGSAHHFFIDLPPRPVTTNPTPAP